MAKKKAARKYHVLGFFGIGRFGTDQFIPGGNMFEHHDSLREVFVRDCDLHGVWHHDPKMWVSHLCRKGYAVSVDDVFSGDDVVWVFMAGINQNGLGIRRIFVRVPLDLVERILVLGYVPDLAQIGG